MVALSMYVVLQTWWNAHSLFLLVQENWPEGPAPDQHIAEEKKPKEQFHAKGVQIKGPI